MKNVSNGCLPQFYLFGEAYAWSIFRIFDCLQLWFLLISKYVASCDGRTVAVLSHSHLDVSALTIQSMTGPQQTYSPVLNTVIPLSTSKKP